MITVVFYKFTGLCMVSDSCKMVLEAFIPENYEESMRQHVPMLGGRV